MEDIYRKWIYEAKTKIEDRSRLRKAIYVLVGPPAVGKTSWIKNNIQNKDTPFTIISRDQIIEDQIFPKYKITNNELYTLNPPKDAEVGKVIPGMEKYGIVATRSNGKKVFSQIATANTEVESLINKEKDAAMRIINNLPKEEPYNIVIDAINATPEERQKVVSMVDQNKDIKKVAVFFKFKDYRAEIEKRANQRAHQMGKELGGQFIKGREIPSGVFDAIFKRIEKPTESEGFDEVIMVDTFKDVQLEPWEEVTAETLTRNFREFLNKEEEKEVLEEKRLGKAWRKKAKQRAKRHDRPYDKSDLKWAHNQQSKWHKTNPELEELYLKEIETAAEAAKTTKEYLLKMKEIRKRRTEEKKQELVAPTAKNLKNRPKPAKNPYTDPKYRKTKFKSRMDYLHKKGIPAVGPAGSFGGIAEQVPQLQARVVINTFGDLKKTISNVMNKERLKAAGQQTAALALDQVLGAIPFASNAKSAFDFVRGIYTATDDKKTKTFIDKINADDQYSKIIDDKLEMEFLKYLADLIMRKPDQESLTNFDVNKELEKYLATQYGQRTLKRPTTS